MEASAAASTLSSVASPAAFMASSALSPASLAASVAVSAASTATSAAVSAAAARVLDHIGDGLAGGGLGQDTNRAGDAFAQQVGVGGDEDHGGAAIGQGATDFHTGLAVAQVQVHQGEIDLLGGESLEGAAVRGDAHDGMSEVAEGFLKFEGDQNLVFDNQNPHSQLRTAPGRDIRMRPPPDGCGEMCPLADFWGAVDLAPH